MRIALKNTSEVCHYFANQVQNEGYAGNVKFYGNNFYSYRTVVAKRINGTIVISSRSYSNTTSKHVSELRHACKHLNIVYIPCVEHTATDNQSNVYNQINELFKLASTARTKKDFYLSKALSIVKDFNIYCEASDNKSLIIDLKLFDKIDFEALKQSEKQRQAVELAKRKEREAENALENSVKISQWLSGERSDIGYGVTNETLLRVKGEVIQTSRGAEIPLNFAPRLWLLVNQVIKSCENLTTDKKVGHYTLTSISKDGDITVGCHFIKYNELERIAKILGYIKS